MEGKLLFERLSPPATKPVSRRDVPGVQGSQVIQDTEILAVGRERESCRAFVPLPEPAQFLPRVWAPQPHGLSVSKGRHSPAVRSEDDRVDLVFTPRPRMHVLACGN